MTAIKESKDLAILSMEALFGKLLAYEHELNQQSLGEDNERKRRSIALKTNCAREITADTSSEDEEDENLNLLVKRFNKFLRRQKFEYESAGQKG